LWREKNGRNARIAIRTEVKRRMGRGKERKVIRIEIKIREGKETIRNEYGR
jgi:hypothetical protein